MNQHCKWSTINLNNFYNYNHLIFFYNLYIWVCRSMISNHESPTLDFFLHLLHPFFFIFIIFTHLHQTNSDLQQKTQKNYFNPKKIKSIIPSLFYFTQKNQKPFSFVDWTKSKITSTQKKNPSCHFFCWLL
jgi:hypothetical protein